MVSSREKALDGYRRLILEATKRGELDLLFRELCRTDLFFLLIYVLGGMTYANNDWVFSKCRMVEEDPDGFLDIWPRGHYKSTIVTFALTIQEVINDPETTIGIFSFNRPIAKGFLRQIKREFESNERLKELFPEIFWQNPEKEAPKWSEDDGLVVKRTQNPKESTIEAWGLVDGQPTSRHYRVRVYDDVVTTTSVSSPEMIGKVTEAFSVSLNLGTLSSDRMRMAGTRYHYADTYAEIIRRGTVTLRLFSATEDGEFDGVPVLLTRESLKEKIRDMGVYVASCQLFGNPVMAGEEVFNVEDLRYWKPKGWERMTVYVVVDPAGEKKKGSDYTVMWVIGLAQDSNYYVIDGLRDKLGLKERADRLFKFVRDYRPKAVGYEKYGMQADIPYIQERMANDNFNFNIVPLGGSTPKNDRIKRLQPLFQEHRIFIPETLVRGDYQGKPWDLTRQFIDDEYSQFPYMAHDDMLDCMARVIEPDLSTFFPLRVSVDESGKPMETWDTYGYNTFDALDMR